VTLSQNYADQYERGVDTARGRGEFVGESDTLEESQRKYAKIIADYQKEHPEAGRYTPEKGPGPDYNRSGPSVGGFAPAKSGWYSNLEKNLRGLDA